MRHGAKSARMRYIEAVERRRLYDAAQRPKRAMRKLARLESSCKYATLIERNAAILEMYFRGESAETIANQFGLSRASIYLMAWKHGRKHGRKKHERKKHECPQQSLAAKPPVKPKPLRIFPRDAVILEMRNRGARLADIGKHFGVSRQRIRQILRRVE